MINTTEGKKYCSQEGLAAYCIRMLLGCDQETADKFSEWHYKHLNHALGSIVNESVVLEKDSEIASLKEEKEAIAKELELLRNKIREVANV